MSRIGSLQRRDFSKQLRKFKLKTELQMTRALRFAMLEFIESIQHQTQPSVKVTGGSFEVGKMALDTTELNESLTTGLTGGVTAGPSARSYEGVVDRMKLGDRIEFRWTAPHASYHEFGFTHASGKEVPGRHFVGQGAAKFPQMLENAARKVKTRSR